MMYEEIINKCPLFSGLSGDSLQTALRFFNAVEKKYPAGQILNRPGEPLSNFGLVLSGNVQVCMDDINGTRIIMAGVAPGETFGESLCLLKREADIIIICVTETVLLVMNTDFLYNNTGSSDGAELSRRFCAMLASRTLKMNDRIQLLSQNGIRDKIITLLSQYAVHGSDEIFLPFNRETLAVYLGVNRSALSRELGKMRDAGIIEFCKDRFKIL